MSDGDIDPRKFDVAQRRPRKSRAKAPAPAGVKPWADEAKARMHKRPAPPGVMFERNGTGDAVAASPHADTGAWELQIADAFGTRSMAVVHVFLDQLADLCSKAHDGKGWKPNESEMSFALAFINTTRPRSEVEAALAAQMVAVHWLTMMVAGQSLQSGYADPRSASVVGKLARTYAMQLDTLGRMRGKSSRSTQKITVRKENHVHYHDNRGGGAAGAQPDATGSATVITGARQPTPRAALPSPDEAGQVVPIASRRR